MNQCPKCGVFAPPAAPHTNRCEKCLYLPGTPYGFKDKHEPRTVEQAAGRNEACPCGSGKKYKKCCLVKP